MHRDTFIAKLTEVQQTVEELLTQLHASTTWLVSHLYRSRREYRSACQRAGKSASRSSAASSREFPSRREHGIQGRLSPMGALAADWRVRVLAPFDIGLAAPICLAFKADLSKRKRVKQKEVKEGHEKAIGRQLLKALKLNGKFLRHGEDNGEPDLIYSLDGKTVGIEIATAFYHNEQAEIESQLALGKLKSGRFGTPLGVPNGQDKVILSRAQWELDDKCSKSYSGDEVWLCIDLQAPLLEISEAKQLADAITIPARHKFARIYFGFHALFDGKGFTVLRRF
jgi:hypothetical protein